MNTGVQGSFAIMIFSRSVPSGGIARSYGSSIYLDFFKILYAVLIVAVSIYILTNSVGEFPFLPTLSSTYCL